MSDEQMREKQRKAILGDPQAQESYSRELQRGLPWSPWAEIGVGEWAYVESGPNYHEVGMLREVRIDGLGVAWAILDKVRRKSDEMDGAPSGWLFEAGDGIMIPATACSLIQPAAQRYRQEKFW